MKNNPKRKFMLNLEKADPRTNLNTVVIGSSGSGKTRSVVYPALLNLKRDNAVAVFTKHTWEQDLMLKILKKRGYRVHVMDFVHPERGKYGFDPLQFLPRQRDIQDLLKGIADADGGHGYNDKYWSDAARKLIETVLVYVRRGYYKGGRGMNAALELLDTAPLVPWGHLNEELEDENEQKLTTSEKNSYFSDHYPDALLLKELNSLFAKVPLAKGSWMADIIGNADSTRGCILSSMQALLENVFTEDVRNIMGKKPCFNFRTLLEPKTVLFIYTSPVNAALHQFAGLFYRQLFQSLYDLAEEQENHALPYPVHVMLDDFATGARIENFPQLISIFREKKISATLLLQSESQLTGLYSYADARTIMDNCDTMIFLGGNDLATCQDMAARLNRPLDEVMYMPVGQEFFFRRGQKPIKTWRYDLNQDPAYQEALAREKAENSKMQRVRA